MKKSRYISAGAGERMQYIAHKYNDTTIRFILQYPGLLDPDILCAAAAAVVGSVDVLHASYMAGNMVSRWRVQEKYRVADYFALAECDGDPMKTAQHLSLQTIAHKGNCQMHVTLVQGSESCAVVVRISHLVVDGGDGKYLLNKLAEAYRLIAREGSAAGLEIKQGSRSATNAYHDLTAKELKALAKPPFSGAKTDFPFADSNARGPLRMLRATIPADVMAQARIKGKTQGATVNDLLLTACYRAYAKTTGRQGAMSISALMDLRQHCKDGISEGISNMSGGLNTELKEGVQGSFCDTLETLVAQTRAAKENPLAGLDGLPLIHAATKTLPLWLLLQAADLLYSSMSLSLTNLGNIPCEPLTMGHLKPIGGLFGGPVKQKTSVQVGTASFDGTAELTILGDFATEDLPSLNQFLDHICGEIRDYLEE